MLKILEVNLAEPSARGLADAVARAVASGSLEAGTRLPPIRTVADALQLSPTTVTAAWATLRRAGTIRTAGRHGSFIAETGATPFQARYRRAVGTAVRFSLDLSTGVPDPALLPSWSAALRALGDLTSPHSYLDDPVVPELATAVRETWPFPAEALTITDGATDAVASILGLLGGFGVRVAVENPAFPPFVDLLESAGMRPVPVELDECGPTVDSVKQALAADVDLVLLQPRGQNPTGISLHEPRARELAGLLSKSAVTVVEDDSLDGIAETELVSLGSYLPGQVLHVRSFSKAYGPDLRLAAVGGPDRLVRALEERRQLGQGWSSRLLQRLLLHLLTTEASTSEVAEARATYAQRRRALVDALRADGIPTPGDDGINIWVPVLDEVSALQSLAANGIGAAPGSPFQLTNGQQAEPHIRVTSALLTDHSDEVATALSVAARAGGPIGR